MNSRLENIESKLEKIESKQDKILDEIIENKIINTRNTASLEEHIKRTNMLQEELNVLKEELKPVEKHVAMVSGALKLLGVISLLASLTVAIFNIIKIFHH